MTGWTKVASLTGEGYTAYFESEEKSHLHFEVLKNDKPVDPAAYLPEKVK